MSDIYTYIFMCVCASVCARVFVCLYQLSVISIHKYMYIRRDKYVQAHRGLVTKLFVVPKRISINNYRLNVLLVYSICPRFRWLFNRLVPSPMNSTYREETIRFLSLSIIHSLRRWFFFPFFFSSSARKFLAQLAIIPKWFLFRAGESTCFAIFEAAVDTWPGAKGMGDEVVHRSKALVRLGRCLLACRRIAIAETGPSAPEKSPTEIARERTTTETGGKRQIRRMGWGWRRRQAGRHCEIDGIETARIFDEYIHAWMYIQIWGTRSKLALTLQQTCRLRDSRVLSCDAAPELLVSPDYT